MLVALFACDGGDGDGSDPTPASRTGVVVSAAEATVETGAVALDMTVEFAGTSQVPDGTKIGMTGRSTFGDPRTAELHADFEALGVGSIDMLIDDQDIYMRGGVIDQVLRSAKGGADWLYVDLSSSSRAVEQFADLSSGQNDASLLLYFLFGTTGDVDEAGSDTIDGVEATRYSTTADLDAALADAPPEVRDSLELNISQLEAQGVETRLDADVWIDGDGLIRQVAYAYRLSAESGGGEMRTTATFSEFGEPIRLDLPDRADVIDVTELQGKAT